MSTPMNAEIQDIIKKNLPEEVGQNLKKVLKQGEDDARRIVFCDEEIRTLNEQISKLKKVQQTQNQLTKRESEVGHRENGVKEKELRHELEEFKVTAAELRTKDLKEIVSLVFQNNQYKHTRNLSKQTHDPQCGTQHLNDYETTESEG